MTSFPDCPHADTPTQAWPRTANAATPGLGYLTPQQIENATPITDVASLAASRLAPPNQNIK